MWTIPLLLAGAGIMLSLSPDLSAIVMNKIGTMVPSQLKWNEAAAWFAGHQSTTLMYSSLALFFVTRTVSRLVDR